MVMDPSSSEALYHLGNGQLNQYDASSEARWLKYAELSFRASLDMEGKEILTTVIPDQLKEQDWWKNKDTKAQAKPSSSLPTSSSVSKGPAGAAGKKPVTTVRTQPGKQQPASKQPPPGRQQAVGRGKPATTSTTRTQPAGGRGVTTTAASKASGPGAKKPIVDTGGGRGASKQGAQKPSANTRAPTTGKTVVTLGDLKAGSKSSPATPTGQKGTSVSSTSSSTTSTEKGSAGSSKDTDKEVKMNRPSHQARLGLARTLVKTEQDKKLEEAQTLYKEVMMMSPNLHDAYIELGEMLHKRDPKGAVEVYAQFPFQDPPTFDDAFLHGEIIRLVMKSEDYDNPCLASSMVAMGKALGIGVLEKQVAILENKFKSALLKSVYAGVHGKPVDDPELQAFFKFKCWL